MSFSKIGGVIYEIARREGEREIRSNKFKVGKDNIVK
jgi:hypothetical protein